MRSYLFEVHTAEQIAIKAGNVLRGYFGHMLTLDRKGRSDFKTIADDEADLLIRTEIMRHFPGDDIISEESYPLDRGAPRRWVIDPLDGTWRFASGFPKSVPSVSIALVVAGQPVVGVIYAPLEGEGELFSASLGNGAALNGKPIEVDPTEDLSFATVVHDVGKKQRWRIAHIVDRLLQDDGVMASPSFGGAASSIARVAAGTLTGYAAIGLDVWDMAAGIIILREAGAKVTDLQDNEWTLASGSMLAANPVLHRKLVRHINGQ